VVVALLIALLLTQLMPTGYALWSDTLGISGTVSTGVVPPTDVQSILVDKVTAPPGDPQSFAFTASWGATFSLTDGADPHDSGLLAPGTYSVSEAVPAGWALTSAVCSDGSPVTAIVLAAGETVTCTFTNTKQPTRTQGFWATHTAFANDFWNTNVPPNEKTLCSQHITAKEQTGKNRLMGGFWANVAKDTDGNTRSDLDHARMVMLQQLLAAMLNKYGLGTNDGVLVATARAAYCGTNVDAINAAKSALDNFNQSGDSVPIPGSVPAATPDESQSQAALAFWDTTS